MKVVHEWLKEYVGPSIPSVEKLEELFMFHAFEVEGIEKVGEHDVIDLKILPDRASYCLSHRGIAQEIASITGTPLAHDPLLSQERLPSFEEIAVDIEDAHACTRFGAALMTDIEVKDSPQWLKDRLIALGARPINNIVDATNYVMYSLGQPLHAYDADKFPQAGGKWQFQVRFARPQEEVSLIAESGKEGDRIVSLQGTELLIVDKSADLPIGLAGIKGGAFAGVDGATKKIIIEAAHFDPIVTRKTARRLGIVIDGSKRFENNPSQELIPHALREVVALIRTIAGGECKGSIDVVKEKQEAVTVAVDPNRVNALLGLSLSKTEIKSYIERVGGNIEEKGGVFMVTSPWQRTDLNIEEDYIDEVGRVHGYAHVVSVVPETVPLTEYNARHYYSEKVRTILTDLGFSEVITSSFNKKDEVHLRNALASDKSYLRSALRRNLSEVLDKNATLVDLLGAQDTRVFEIGTVFGGTPSEINEHVSLCIGVRSKVQGYTPKDDALLSSVMTALEEKIGTQFSFTSEKGIAECDFTAVFTRLPEPDAYDTVSVSKEIVYKPFSVYPAMSRDIALWVSSQTQPREVEKVINENAGALRVRTTLLDVFSKEGKVSYAFRLVFQSHEKTLTDEEVNAIMETVYKAAGVNGWEVR
jgi:phenylalanyl-tRNA synthetase beta chain